MATLYDAFISYSSEDRNFVQPLASILRAKHVRVWFDEFELRIGDSITASINRGLASSRYGIVVMSATFFAKEWPQSELQALTNMQLASQTRILPVWHKLTHNDILHQAPLLAHLKAANSDDGIDRVAEQLLAVLKPEGSTLIIAQVLLLNEYDFETPVVTDDWWLDLVEYSADYAPLWNDPYWTFDLPTGDEPEQRGKRLAFAAMQREWVIEAEDRNLNELTHPEELLHFIREQPGLFDMCMMRPDWLLYYAPFFAIRGMSGPFEEQIERIYQKGIVNPTDHDSIGNVGKTSRKVLAWRAPMFGGFDPEELAEGLSKGGSYSHFEYIMWLLSDASIWLPPELRATLLDGFLKGAYWGGDRYSDSFRSQLPAHLKNMEFSFDMFVFRINKSGKIDLTKNITKDVLDFLSARSSVSKHILSLPESAEKLTESFLASGAIQAWMVREERFNTRLEADKKIHP